MTNFKPKDKLTIKRTLTVYKEDIKIIKEQKKMALDREDIFNLSEFLRYCLNNKIIIDSFINRER